MATKPIRRLVTGHDAQGRSKFMLDGAADSVLVMDQMADLTVTDFWESYNSPADNTGEADNAERDVHLEPAAGGTIFRVVDFPPDKLWKDGADSKAAFAAIKASHAADGTHADPSMHKTDTVDYAMVITGEIWAVLDTEERLMQAGDVLVQRGTNHAWANRTDQNCRVMFVLCDAVAVT